MAFPAPSVGTRWRLARRKFLQLSIAAGLFRPFAAVAGPILEGAPDEDFVAAVGAWLDTLIPADATPSATALGMQAAIFRTAVDDTSKQLLVAGGRWLQDEARLRGAATFAALSESDREDIASAAAVAPPRTLPRVFFESSWIFATSYYYSQPAIWASLGYGGPPQPAGFPDHDRPP